MKEVYKNSNFYRRCIVPLSLVWGHKFQNYCSLALMAGVKSRKEMQSMHSARQPMKQIENKLGHQIQTT